MSCGKIRPLLRSRCEACWLNRKNLLANMRIGKDQLDSTIRRGSLGQPCTSADQACSSWPYIKIRPDITNCYFETGGSNSSAKDTRFRWYEVVLDPNFVKLPRF
jgi:hypothetical protein